MEKLRVLSLFAGIGGFDLGLERTGGFKTVAFCEIAEFPRRVLKKHWPEVPCYHDVRELTADVLERDGISVDVICGGFPCQDISPMGLRAGMSGETRSGLWSEIARLAGDLRPKFIIVENVSNLLSGPSEQPGGWFGRVLGDLAALGYDAEWHCIPASAIGAPHQRDRVWILAYPKAQRPAEEGENSERQAERSRIRSSILAYPESGEAWSAKSRDGYGSHGGERPLIISSLRGCDSLRRNANWDTEPGICRVADGISDNVDRDGALGNAVVPQIPEMIGRAVLDALDKRSTEGAGQ